MIHKEFTDAELRQVGYFVQELQRLSEARSVRIDSLDGSYLVVNGKDTCLHLVTDAEDRYVVSAVVPL